MQNTRIAVVGAGAQGAGIGADLIRAGLDVTFLEQWPAHVEAMKARGIEVRLPKETQITPVERVFHLCDAASLKTQFDVVFILVKAYDTRWAVELIKPLLTPDGVVVGLQNGMSIDDIASIVGKERTLGAVIEMASSMFDPGVVTRQNGPDTAWFAIGAVDPSAHRHEMLVQSILSNAGTVEVSTDIRSSKWMKLVANAGELVPSAILGESLLDAVALPGVHQFMVECGKEAARACIADGCVLVPIFGLGSTKITDADQYAEDLLGEVLNKFSLPDTLTTVLQDWMKGRRAESANINGHVINVMAQAGLSAPYNRHTFELAQRIEAGTLDRGVGNLELLLNVPNLNGRA